MKKIKKLINRLRPKKKVKVAKIREPIKIGSLDGALLGGPEE